MNSIRTAIAAVTFALVSSAAFAGNVTAEQSYGRDTVSAVGKKVGTAQSKGSYANAVHGRQGGLSAEAVKSFSGKTRVTVDLVNRVGRG